MLRRVSSLLVVKAAGLRIQVVRNAAWMTDDEVASTAKQLSELLNCKEQACLGLFMKHEALRRQSSEHIITMAKLLNVNYESNSILNCGHLLGQKWNTIQQRRFILEELGVKPATLTRVAVFPFIMKRSIFDLKNVDRLIPKDWDVIAGLISQLPDCPRHVVDGILKKLPASMVMAMPVTFVLETVMKEYLQYRLSSRDLSWWKRRQVYEQSLRLMSLRIDLLMKDFALTGSFITNNSFLLSADIFNLQVMFERGQCFSIPMSMLVKIMPKTLLQKTEDLCEIESILRGYNPHDADLCPVPQIYNENPDILKERLNRTADLPNDATPKDTSSNSIVPECPPNPRNHEIIFKYADSTFMKFFLCSFNVSSEEKQEVVRRFKFYQGPLPRGISSVEKAKAFLTDNLGFNREQMLAAPSLLLFSPEVLKEGWQVVTEGAHVEELRSFDEWLKSPLAAEMLQYEIEMDTKLRSLLASTLAEDSSTSDAKDLYIRPQVNGNPKKEQTDDTELETQQLEADLLSAEEEPLSQLMGLAAAAPSSDPEDITENTELASHDYEDVNDPKDPIFSTGFDQTNDWTLTSDPTALSQASLDTDVSSRGQPTYFQMVGADETRPSLQGSSRSDGAFGSRDVLLRPSPRSR